jgi:hypothetical protein
MGARLTPWCLVVLCAGCAAAPSRSLTDRPLRVEALAFFVGQWSAVAEDPGSGKRFTLDYRVRPALDGAWCEGEGYSPELGLRIRDLWGVDARTGELLRAIFDSQGTHGEIRSKGWEGDTLRFEGQASSGGQSQAVRETITRVSDKEFTALWEAKGDAGWTAYSKERLVRR